MATHETTLSMYDAKGEPVGEIDVQIEYRVTDPGSRATHEQPADAPEIDVVHVNMRSAPRYSYQSNIAWVHCWDWLYDAAIAWANENAGDLAAKARLAGTVG